MNKTIVTYFEQFEGFNSFISKVSSIVHFDTKLLFTFLIFLIACLVVVSVLSLIGGLGTYAERKISADIQMRQGPNRVGPFGILQFLADGVKMLTKEDLVPAEADKFLFSLAPLLALLGVFASLAVVPFSSGFTISDLNIGVFYLLGVSSLVGVAIFLGGYASNSKWSILGGMRGASQIISYEIPVTLSILSIVLLAGGLSFGTIISAQGAWPTKWFLFHNPFSFIGFFVLFIGALAETNRAPFDLPEAESELVSGYHTEFSGMRFGFFALAEYIEVFVVCGVAVALYLGGYQVSSTLASGEFFIAELGLSKVVGKQIGQLLELGAFFSKTFLLYYVVIWVRWTLPRLRVDQLMVVCWKYLTPIALINFIGIASWAYFFNGKSFFELLASMISGGGGH